MFRGSLIALCFVIGASAATAEGRVELELQLGAGQNQARRGGTTILDAKATIEPGWHINAHQPNEPFLVPTEIMLTLPPGVSSGTITYPAPEKHAFKFAPGKELLVHQGTLVLPLPINVPADFPGSKVRVGATLHYQACNDTTCAAPAKATAEVVLEVSGSTPGSISQAGSTTARGSTDSDVGRWLEQRGLVVTLLLVMFLGLGLNLTPCVYPLISVTLAFFGRHGGHRTQRVLWLASLYVAGITLSFAIAGVVAALSGGIFGAALQKPPVLIGLALLMVGLSLGSFGVYQFQAPSWLLQRLGSSAHGAFFMGLTMGIVAAPCIGPVVVGLLLYVGSRQDVVLGIELFGALGFGMGLPYLGLALAAGSLKKLPRSGAWMMWIERFFGFMLLGLAVYFITPLLPKMVARFALPALIGIAALYLGFIDASGRNLPQFRIFQRAAGVAGLVLGLWLIAPHRAQASLPWQPYDPVALTVARERHQPVLVDFVADWCIPCHEMDVTTWTDPRVQQAVEGFALLRADVTTETPDTAALSDKFQVQGVPTILLLHADGHEAERLVGYVGPEEMTQALRRVRQQRSLRAS